MRRGGKPAAAPGLVEALVAALRQADEAITGAAGAPFGPRAEEWRRLYAARDSVRAALVLAAAAPLAGAGGLP